MMRFSSSSEDSNGRSLACRFNELPCRLARMIKWFRDEPKRLGWIVTMSCFIFYTVSYSVMYGFSLLFKELVDEFDSKISTTGYVGCIMSATAYLSSPLTAFLLTKISHRSVCILGSLFCAIGAFTSSLVPSIYYLFLTLGIIYGLGVNFLYHSSLCLQLEYFPTKSERPVTVASCGFSASWMVTLPLLHYFITSFGWRIGLQLISAVILGTCLIACIPMCPLPSTYDEDSVQDDKEHEETKSLKNSKEVDRHDSKDLKSSSVDSSKQITQAQMKVFLCKPETWMFFAAVLGTMSGWSFFYINIVSFLRSENTVGLDESQAATIVFMCGIGELVGKLTLFAIAGILQSVPAIYVTALGNALGAVFTIGLLMCSSYVPAAIFVVVSSFARAVWHVYPILGGVEELKHVNGVSTIYLIGLGCGYIAGAFIVGGIYDITGSYEVPMVLVAGIFVISGFLFAFVPLIRHVRSRKQKRLHGYFSVSAKDSKDCGECRRLSRKFSKADEVLWQCDDHQNLPKTVVVEDNRLMVECLMSTV